jgi:hypothetical protein
MHGVGVGTDCLSVCLLFLDVSLNQKYPQTMIAGKRLVNNL